MEIISIRQQIDKLSFDELSVVRLAKLLHTSTDTIYRLIKTKKLEAKTKQGRMWVTKEALIKYLEANHPYNNDPNDA